MCVGIGRRAMLPRGAHSVLSSRTLAASHRRLGEVLRPGMTVLDVGGGTGAITAGIAEIVGAEGRVVGVDADESLIAEARRSHRRDGLTFEVRDLYDLGFTSEFDVVASSRVLQWLAKPRDALDALIAACRPNGLVVVLDYNWAKVAESRGVQMVADGYLTEAERALAEKQFRSWATDSAIGQRLYLLCVEGIVPQR